MFYKSKFKRNFNFLIFLFIFIFLIWYFFIMAPYNNKDVVIQINQMEPVSSIQKELKDKNVIKNIDSFKIFLKIFLNKGKVIVPGDYLIHGGSPVWVVAWQISNGKFNVDQIKVTLREGLTNDEISQILEKKIKDFDKNLFLLKVKDKQGYLFPDTYFLFTTVTLDEIINKLSDNFNHKIYPLEDSIKKQNKSLNEIIVMASILEGEASGKNDIGIISGILWKRLSIGMPLQVDVYKDTYKNKGLPANPINNPGIASIKAAINPVYSDYLYYLHDNLGRVHFAKTFEEHRNNIKKYLK